MHQFAQSGCTKWINFWAQGGWKVEIKETKNFFRMVWIFFPEGLYPEVSRNTDDVGENENILGLYTYF